MTDRETVPCELCGKQTPMTGTKRCDGCWELEGRIHGDPELARRILAEFDKAAAPRAPKQEASGDDFIESVGMMLEAVGYTKEYALQWPGEKVSVTFKRWFDEQVARAAATAPATAPAAPQGVASETVWPTLKAMAMNYSDGHHWDHLDARACRQGAEEIKALLAALAQAGQAAPAGGVTEPTQRMEVESYRRALLAWHNASEDEIKENIAGLRLCLRKAARILLEHPALTTATRAAEPEGWKLVPISPTVEMQDACLSLVDLTQGDPEDHRYDDGRKTAEQLYAAMLAASPTPPMTKDGGQA